MLLWNSVGTGKTCSAIAAATNSFEKAGYTILWVTRTTLKNDIWKNMFDQVCNESIRYRMEHEGLTIPVDQKQRMKLLSKSWQIRPISYKQFTNLINKQNAFYKKLVSINGEEDPLRKTLLIIDEAHKLYGGTDLSTIERPDMGALQNSLLKSYQISGRESVKLLLMTATPITKNPMELIKIINLCKPIGSQIPHEFAEFSETYLNENGEFTDKGREQYLDDIAGYVSYLNREKDARQFAQPQIEHISTPMIKDIREAEKFDKKIIRSYLNSDIGKLKARISETSEALKGELGDLDSNKFGFLKEDKCDELEGKAKKHCVKLVKMNIKQLTEEAKEYVKQIREEIKEIREQVRNHNLFKTDTLAKIDETIDENPEEYAEYKKTILYNIKTNCKIKIGEGVTLKNAVKEHPVISDYNRKIEEYDENIKALQQALKVDVAEYKMRNKNLQQLLKEELTDAQKNVLKMTIRDNAKSFKEIMKKKRKDAAVTKKNIKSEIKAVEKEQKQTYNKIRKTIKRKVMDEKKKARDIVRAEKKLRKTMRKQEGYREDINHDVLKNLVKKYSDKIDEELVGSEERLEAEEQHALEEKEAARKIRAEARAEKREAKQAEQAEKKLEKQAERAQIKEERERARATLKAEQQAERELKKQNTRKNQSKKNT
jgi:hypothetical protein